MQKSKKQQISPKGYLSWSQLNMFERDVWLYKRVYIDGEEQFESDALKIGKALAERLENGIECTDKLIEYLAIFMPKYQKREFEIKGEFDGIPVLGKLDGFNEKTLEIGEYKTGKNWNQALVDKSGQLTFYAMLVWLKYGKLPSKIKLHWAQTEVDDDGELRITGSIKTFETKRTLSDILLLGGRIKKAWEEILNLTEKYSTK